MNQKYKAIFLDFDGTLTDDKTNIMRENPNDLLDFLNKKRLFSAFATGKGLYYIKDLLKDSPKLLNNYFILYDGSLIINPLTSKVFFSRPIDESILPGICSKLSNVTRNFYLNRLDGLFSEKNNLSPDSSLFRFWKPGLYYDDVYQIYIRDIQESKVGDVELCLRDADISFYKFGSRRKGVSILAFAKGCNKATAIKNILAEIHILESQAIIVGDGKTI